MQASGSIGSAGCRFSVLVARQLGQFSARAFRQPALEPHVAPQCQVSITKCISSSCRSGETQCKIACSSCCSKVSRDGDAYPCLNIVDLAYAPASGCAPAAQCVRHISKRRCTGVVVGCPGKPPSFAVPACWPGTSPPQPARHQQLAPQSFMDTPTHGHSHLCCGVWRRCTQFN